MTVDECVKIIEEIIFNSNGQESEALLDLIAKAKYGEMRMKENENE